MSTGSVSELEMEVEMESAKLKEIQNQLAKNLELDIVLPIKKTAEEQKESDSKSVYVGNVDWYSKTEDIENHFKDCGSIVRVTIPMDKFTKRQKNFAYVEFDSVEAVEKALLLSSSILRNRPIVVTAKRTNVPGMSARGTSNGFRGGSRRGNGRGAVVVKYVYVNGSGPSRRGMSRGGRGRFAPY